MIGPRSTALLATPPTSTADLALRALAAGCSLVTTGVYANFSARVLPRLAAMPVPDAVSAMQRFNATAVRAPFMVCFFGAALAAVVVLVREITGPRDAATLPAAAGAALVLAGFAVTVVVNVPLNDRLAALDSSSAGAAAGWRAFLAGWRPANTARAVLTAAGVASLVGASLRG